MSIHEARESQMVQARGNVKTLQIGMHNKRSAITIRPKRILWDRNRWLIAVSSSIVARITVIRT